MAKFTIRVVLHDATWEHYVDLEAKLAQLGIVDEISAGNGKRYKMPPAEYTYEGDSTYQQVQTAVEEIAGSLGVKFAVMTNEVINRSWRGLDPA